MDKRVDKNTFSNAAFTESNSTEKTTEPTENVNIIYIHYYY